jgi:enoyl-CoA hydratase/carnithine racemase
MIDVSVTGGCGVITVPSFAALESLDPGFARILAQAVTDLSDDDFVKAIVLRASGQDFADPASSLPSTVDVSVAEWESLLAGSRGIYQAVCFSKKVTIAAVSGRCGAAGTALLLAADLAVAERGAAFKAPFATVPEANFALAALTMRLNRAKAWAITDGWLTAEEALDTGLVNALVGPGEAWEKADDIAAEAAEIPLDGVVMSKMLLQAVLDAHGVGAEYDMAPLYRSAMESSHMGGGR